MRSSARHLLLVATLLVAALSAHSQFGSSGFGDKTAVPEIGIDAKFAKPVGGRIDGVVTVTIPETWHVNSWKPKDDFAIPTKVRVESPALKIDAIDYPPHVERALGFAGGQLLPVYEGTVRIPVHGTAIAADGDVTVGVFYQACNDSVCLPPKEVTKTAALSAITVDSLGEPAAAQATDGAFQKLADAPGGASKGLFSGDIGSTMQSRGLATTLLVVFVLGMALTLTPCVYPLIPLTMAFFSSQTGGSTARRVGLSSTYVLGIAITYSTLGVFAALSGALFGAWMQKPGVLGFFALLMVLLALSMFGLYDINVPQFIANRASARAGFIGSLTMGLLAGIVAAPCVGPFVVSLIALVSQSGNPYLGFLLFFVLALGLGVPFLLLGIFSSGASSLPRSGPWLVKIKQALGFVLIAMAFYFLRPVVGDEIYRWGVAGSLILGALFLFVRGEQTRAGNVIRVVCGLLLLAGAVPFVMPRTTGPEISWAKYDDAKIAAAAAEGKPVIIDFYADWCLPCKELDHNTFNQKGVVDEAKRFATFKADLTRGDDERSKELVKRYGIIGVPTIVFIDAKGNEIRELRLTGFEKPEAFLERLRKAK
ncbi:MAG: protein-disulfide reductase DsbD [Thermoanaerobaculia bacterium]|jgi:thiol:disulfide interchange protein DsbD